MPVRAPAVAVPAPPECESALHPVASPIAPTVQQLLRLQQSAGNQAVARLVGSSWGTLARQGDHGGGSAATVTADAPGQITGSVGRGGANNPPDVAVVTGLLTRAGVDASDLEAAIEGYQRDTMGWSHPDGRIDPGGKTLRRLSGGAAGRAAGGAATNGAAPAQIGPGPAQQTGPMPAGPTPAGPIPAGPTPAGPAPASSDAAPEGAEQTFRDFAAGRSPLFAALGAASEEDRRAARQALRAYDAQHLPALRALQQQMGGRWNIQDPAARDAVLAAIQLEAATDAEGDLHRNSEEVHRRVAAAAGMPLDAAWCGMFTVDHYRHSGMDSELAAGFLHVHNVHDFFTYRHTRNPRRVPRWIWADHAWHDLREYHQSRGGERQWLEGAEVSRGGELDIRAGDAVLIDVGHDGTPNHIVKASHYDPASGHLLTIGGNDGGYVIDQRGGPATGTGNLGEAEAASGERMKRGGWGSGAAGGHVGSSVHDVRASGALPGAIFGVGRPSIVDFEEHRYDRSGNIRRPPAPLSE